MKKVAKKPNKATKLNNIRRIEYLNCQQAMYNERKNMPQKFKSFSCPRHSTQCVSSSQGVSLALKHPQLR